MSQKNILITAPSLDTKKNVSGISSVVNFIVGNNTGYNYIHFELGRRDNEKRNLLWLLRMIGTTFKWMGVITFKKIHLVHFNFALCKASVVRDAPLVIYARLLQKKMIIHLHGGEYLIEEKAPGWMRFLLKGVFTGNIPVVVLSPIEKEAAIANYNIKNCTALPNCVDVKDAKTVQRVYDANEVLKLLFMGRIRINKGVEHIYKALTVLKSKQVPFKFYMAGAGPDEVEYVEKFSALLGSDFEFKGVVSGTAKAALLKSTDVFLLPSFFPEGLPMALLETMSYGLVPLVTDIGSIKYVVTSGENGFMLGDDPPPAIVSAVEQLVTDRTLLKTLSIKASHYIFDHYDPVNYINRLNEIYKAA